MSRRPAKLWPCATPYNVQALIDRGKDEPAFLIEVIQRRKRGHPPFTRNHIARTWTRTSLSLYRLGGGKNRTDVFAGNTALFSSYFNIGTIGVKGQVTEEQWDNMKDYIRKETRGICQ